jgi:hypothetical protein
MLGRGRNAGGVAASRILSLLINGLPTRSIGRQGLKHMIFEALNVTAEAMTYKGYS